MTLELFKDPQSRGPEKEKIADATTLLRGFALSEEEALLKALKGVVAQAPFRHMVTPGGHVMAVAMTNCGSFGWVSDRRGYRYDGLDPTTNNPWPAMPDSFLTLAARASNEAGFHDFVPDACLINRYEPGTQLSMHQDKNERDFSQPIVSASLGIRAVFLFGTMERSGEAQPVGLHHGDVVVWGGEDRLRYHGVRRLKEAEHPALGRVRINLTFRKAR